MGVGSNETAAAGSHFRCGAEQLFCNDQREEGGKKYTIIGLRGLSCLSATIRLTHCVVQG